jgi:acetoin utilization deacetylase AcuC-like enzyme
MAIIYHPRYLDHYQDSYHPESPNRLITINARLEREDLNKDVLTPEPILEKDLEKIHTPEHIDFIKSVGEGRIDFDTQSHIDTFDIALLACGGAILAAETTFTKNQPAMALLRPPGHHAGPDYCGGFCYFNNLALAAEYLLKNVSKVAIVDIDVHHGNGTSDIFCQRKDVLYISTHQWGVYPGTGPIDYVGEENGEGFTVNIPLTSRCGDSTYYKAFEEVVEPILKQYEPEAFLVSIGGDAHYMDPLASLTLSSKAYIQLAKILLDKAKELCESRISFYLEGGYHTGALAEVIAGIVGQFQGKEISLDFNDVYDRAIFGEDIIEKVKDVQGEFWSL